ncbi:Imm50 family immunity protein [Streptomyces sp. NBC_01197]|uniref:Imm50 family immunity protein n=1 Tax=Streptomyces sp. NBC_01197 TaxID=2903768 RepID=UPI002E0E77BF|nr:immunity 50 family protein [Streptomyces sp. NBC_01197]
MDNATWPTFLSDPRQILDLYDQPPALNRCDLFYVHIDERDTSITFGFETRELPARPRQKWKKKPFNSIRFFISFTGISRIRINGWESPGEKEVEISRHGEDELTVHVTSKASELSNASDLAFQAESASLTHSAAQLMAPGSGP